MRPGLSTERRQFLEKSGRNSVGRVSASHAECRGFDPRCPLHNTGNTMILLILLLLAYTQSPVQGIWNLRAGLETEGIPAVTGASIYNRVNMASATELSSDEMLRRINGGDNSMIVPLTALLVSEGKAELAEIYWELEGFELPATRKDLLDALAWFGRYELYPVMALEPAIPPDMQESMHSGQCGAVCALGWMTTREDGLFHGEDLVSPSDIRILSNYFPQVSPVMKYITGEALEYMFRTTTGVL